jgi:hypothetical protein
MKVNIKILTYLLSKNHFTAEIVEAILVLNSIEVDVRLTITLLYYINSFVSLAQLSTSDAIILFSNNTFQEIL